jgi:hypothetical protein
MHEYLSCSQVGLRWRSSDTEKIAKASSGCGRSTVDRRQTNAAAASKSTAIVAAGALLSCTLAISIQDGVVNVQRPTGPRSGVYCAAGGALKKLRGLDTPLISLCFGAMSLADVFQTLAI